jgi:hypothetical protein
VTSSAAARLTEAQSVVRAAYVGVRLFTLIIVGLAVYTVATRVFNWPRLPLSWGMSAWAVSSAGILFCLDLVKRSRDRIEQHLRELSTSTGVSVLGELVEVLLTSYESERADTKLKRRCIPVLARTLAAVDAETAEEVTGTTRSRLNSMLSRYGDLASSRETTDLAVAIVRAMRHLADQDCHATLSRIARSECDSPNGLRIARAAREVLPHVARRLQTQSESSNLLHPEVVSAGENASLVRMAERPDA